MLVVANRQFLIIIPELSMFSDTQAGPVQQIQTITCSRAVRLFTFCAEVARLRVSRRENKIWFLPRKSFQIALNTTFALLL